MKREAELNTIELFKKINLGKMVETVRNNSFKRVDDILKMSLEEIFDDYREILRGECEKMGKSGIDIKLILLALKLDGREIEC